MFAVVPLLIGPLQALIAALPAIVMGLGWLIVSLFKPSTMKKFLKLLWRQKIQVAVLLLAVWGFVRLHGFLVRRQTSASTEAVAATADWPVFRGDAARRGYVPGSEEPVSGGIRWTFSHNGVKTFFASPAIVGNRLYITSARYELFKNVGAICCVDADTGKLVWDYTGGYRATFSSPSVSGNYLVVGEGLHFVSDARVFCLDVKASEKKRQGVVLWSYRTKSHVESSPAIADGRAFIGAGDDGLYCFALDPAPDGSAKVLWHLDGKKYPDCEASPVVSDGKVYFGLGIGGQAICCVEAETGKELWRVKTPYPVFSAPAVSGNKLFAGMGIGDYINDAGMLAANLRAKMEKEGRPKEEIDAAVSRIKPAGEVWCVNLDTHEVEWRFAVGDTVLGTVAVDGERVYFGSRDRTVYCVSTDGKLVGKRAVHAPIITAAAVGSRYVYVVTDAGRVLGLSRDELSPVWELPLNSPVMSSPAVARGRLYVGTTKNGLVCAGTPAGTREKQVWAGYLGGPGRSGWMDGSLLPPRGDYAWSYPPADETGAERTDVPFITAPAAFLNGSVFVPFNMGSRRGLVRLDWDPTSEQPARQAWFAGCQNRVFQSPAVTEEVALCVDGKPGDRGRFLRAVDVKTGAEVWRYPVEDAAGGQFVIEKERLFVASLADGFACLDISSPKLLKEVWKSRTGPLTGAPVVVGDMVVASAGSPARIVCLDAQTGILLWERTPPVAVTTGPLFLSGLIWAGDRTGVTGYRIVDGSPAVSISCGAVTAPLVAQGSTIACVTAGREIVLIDTESGKETLRVRGRPVRTEFPPVFLENGLLYAADEAIESYDLGTGEISEWTKLRETWPGRMTSPMIVAGGHVFCATQNEGFICLRPKME